MKIATIVGARPQFIKASAISRSALSGDKMKEVIIHTGQHYDDNMAKIFFEELNIPMPHFNLGIAGGSHGEQTGRMLEAIEKVLLKIKPSGVLVYGDTNSTLAGALAAVKLHIPVIHVEAGLRSFNFAMPEEVNRIVVDQISSFLFTPNDIATKNLINEGMPKGAIYQVGDVMYDVALFYAEHAKASSNIMQRLSLIDENYILATIHRAENTDDAFRLNNIFKFLSMLAENRTVVVPLHPRTKQSLLVNGLFDAYNKKLLFIDPVGYLDMVNLEKRSAFIVTDSGGVQKEAFFHKRPCLTLREESEWVELEDLGWNRLISPRNDADTLLIKARNFLENYAPKESMPYGLGNSADLITEEILKGLS